MTSTFLTSISATCIFITRTVVPDVYDDDGNDTYTETPVPVGGCLFAPGGSTETLGNQDTVVTNPTLYVPTGVTVPQVIDAIQVPGVGEFEVDGSPSVWPANPTGWSIVIKLRAVSG